MKDFFISYTSADEKIAEWIAWVLEDAGYTTVIQKWDFTTGTVFPWEMQKATVECSRTLIVLSPDFLKSKFTAAEWAAAFKQDPTGEGHKLVPVRVSDFDVPGMLGVFIYIDLVGYDEKQAKEELLAGIKVKRRKPVDRPRFEIIPARPVFPVTDSRKYSDTGAALVSGIGTGAGFADINIEGQNLTNVTVTVNPDSKSLKESWRNKLLTWLTIVSVFIAIISFVLFTLPKEISSTKQEQSCLFWGLVEDQAGKPVPDAEINILRGAEDTTLIGKGSTTGSGEFRIPTQVKTGSTVYVIVTKNGKRGVDQFTTLGVGNTVLQFKEQ